MVVFHKATSYTASMAVMWVGFQRAVHFNACMCGCHVPDSKQAKVTTHIEYRADAAAGSCRENQGAARKHSRTQDSESTFMAQDRTGIVHRLHATHERVNQSACAMHIPCVRTSTPRSLSHHVHITRLQMTCVLKFWNVRQAYRLLEQQEEALAVQGKEELRILIQQQEVPPRRPPPPFPLFPLAVSLTHTKKIGSSAGAGERASTEHKTSAGATNLYSGRSSHARTHFCFIRFSTWIKCIGANTLNSLCSNKTSWWRVRCK